RQREGSALQPIRVRPRPEGGLTAIGSRNHRKPETDAWVAKMGITEFLPSGSSLKFCLIAEGLADVYPRHGPTMEWDTAAGQAVLEAAGGRVLVLEGDTEGGPLRYGKIDAGFLNPHFIAWGGK
ncbi:MAG TPA: inositol monophosphatase family protein, partial [Allosphingosinicella sp.]